MPASMPQNHASSDDGPGVASRTAGQRRRTVERGLQLLLLLGRHALQLLCQVPSVTHAHLHLRGIIPAVSIKRLPTHRGHRV